MCAAGLSAHGRRHGGLEGGQQLAAVLAWGHAEPALAGSEQVAGVGKAEQIGNIGQAVAFVGEVLACQFAACVVQQLLVAHRFGLQAALQCAIGQVQSRGHVFTARLTQVQDACNLGAYPGTGERLAELPVSAFIRHLSRLGIPVVDLTSAETTQDMETLDAWLAVS